MGTKLLHVIAEEYIRSFRQKKGGNNSLPSQIDQELVVSSEENRTWEIQPLTPCTTALLTFVQLEKSKLLAESLAANKNVLDFCAWQDLHLLCGHRATPAKSLHAKVDRTVTTLGKCVLATTLVTPAATQEAIVKKQQITKVLCEDAELKENLGTALARIKEDETKRASLWHKSSPFEQDKYNNELQRLFYELALFHTKRGTRLTIWALNPTSPSKLKWLNRIKDLFFICLYPFIFPLIVCFATWVLSWLLYKRGFLQESYSVTRTEFNVFYVFTFSLGLLIQPYQYYSMRKSVISLLAERMATLQNFLKSAHEVDKLVMAHPKLKELYKDELKAVRHLWQMGKQKSALGRMVRALQGPSWKDWRYFTSPTGQLLATYTLFQKYKRVFASAFYEIGKLDVCLSTATLLLETEADACRNKYVLSHVVSPTAKDDVVVKGEGIWHPFLKREVAVPNDLALDSQKGNRLIVITGPNRGGKSTYILSSGLAALLSQSLGIAPAKSFTHTCFKKLIVYLKPTQHLTFSLSRFGAAFELLRRHRWVLEATEGPVFAIIDEILKGVDAKTGLRLSRDTLERRHKKFPNCVTLLTTHYIKLSELADNLPGVANKHLEAIVKGKGMRTTFTYRLLDGVSKQNIGVL